MSVACVHFGRRAGDLGSKESWSAFAIPVHPAPAAFSRSPRVSAAAAWVASEASQGASFHNARGLWRHPVAAGLFSGVLAVAVLARRHDAKDGRRSVISLAAAPNGRRVVVTGMGVTSCLGSTLDEVAEALYEARSGITTSSELVARGIRSQVHGKPKLGEGDMKKLIPRKAARFMGENARYAFIAMDRALQDANLPPELYEDNPRIATILGQGGTSIPDVVETVEAVQSGLAKWPNIVGPYRVPRTMGSAVSAVLSSHFRMRGPSFSVSSACSTGAHCIGVAMEQIQLDKADAAIAGAGEDVSWAFSAMFDCMGALSTKRNDEPTKASRAFDKDRDGFVISGGGGMLVLEELEHARARGARIYAELVGYAATADGRDVVAPSGEGAERCMRMALAMANDIGGEKPVDYINAHGTSTPVGDVQEVEAIKRVFEPLGYFPNIGSTKSLSGHSLAATGAQEAVYSLLMAERGFMAKSANIDDLIDEARGLKILTERKDSGPVRVMSNSFGFGGTNAVLIFDKWTAD